MTEYDLGKVVGDDGDDGNGIASISKTGTSGLVDTYTITYDDGDSDTFTVTNGADGQTGATGNGIASVTKTGTSGLVDTYTINYTNGGSDTFTVTNGSDATVTIVTSFSSTTSDSKVPSEKLVKTELDKKIATSNTSGLVKNDGTIDTNTYLTSSSLSGYQTTSNLVTSFSSTTSDSKYPSEKLTKTELDKKIEKSNTTGLVKNDGTIDTNSYITSSSLPTKTSDLTNDGSSSSDSLVYVETSATSGLLKNDGTVDTSAYITSSSLSGYQTTSNLVTSFSGTTSDSKYPSEKLVKTELDKKIATSNTSGLVKNDGTIDTSSYITSSAITGKEDASNKVTSWSSTVNDTHYPSEKLVKDTLDTKQATLVSGTNIKTVNNESLLGSGNITIQGGGGSGGSYINDFYGDSSTNELVIDYDTGVSQADIVTSWSSTTSNSNVPSEKLVKDSLDAISSDIGSAIQYINGSGS